MLVRKLLAFSACTATLILVPIIVGAQYLRITPVTVDSSAPVEEALKNNKSSASTKIEGAGGILRLTYIASDELKVYMVPLSTEGRFVPNEFLRLALPATEGDTVEIDLTVSPGWRPSKTTWIVHLLTKNEETDAGFAAIEFVPVSLLETIAASFQHIFTAEPYSPSTYHAVRGYRVFGNDATVIMGILLLIVAGATLLRAKKSTKLRTLVIVILTFQGLYGLRFGLDLLRFSSEHASGYAQGFYDEAGSVHQITPVLRILVSENPMKSEAETTVFVCRSGTNFKEKILRYFSYPIRISSDVNDAKTSDFALVMNADDWSFDAVLSEEEKTNDEVLRCGDLSMKAQKLREFPDGSILFSISR